MNRLLTDWLNQFQSPMTGQPSSHNCLQLRIRIPSLELLLAPHILAESSTDKDSMFKVASRCVYDGPAPLDLMTR